MSLGGIMKEIIQKRINRIEYELCRLEVCHDAGKYDGMEDVYFNMVLVLKTKLAGYREDLEGLKAA